MVQLMQSPTRIKELGSAAKEMERYPENQRKFVSLVRNDRPFDASFKLGVGLLLGGAVIGGTLGYFYGSNKDEPRATEAKNQQVVLAKSEIDSLRHVQAEKGNFITAAPFVYTQNASPWATHTVEVTHTTDISKLIAYKEQETNVLQSSGLNTDSGLYPLGGVGIGLIPFAALLVSTCIKQKGVSLWTRFYEGYEDLCYTISQKTNKKDNHLEAKMS